MKYKGLFCFFAVIVLAAAAPVPDDYQEALLQEALEELERGHARAASRTLIDKSLASAESEGKDLVFNILKTVADYAIRKATGNPSSVQSGQEDQYRVVRRQRFLPREVQRRYNTGNEQQETAEMEDFSSLLQLLGNNQPNGGTGGDFSTFVKLFVQIFQQILSGGGGSEEENEAEIEETAAMEDLSSLLQLLGNVSPNGGGTGDSSSVFKQIFLQMVQLFLKSFMNGGGSEQSVAEIEGFKSFLSNALNLVDEELKPTDRTPEEDQEAVENPSKWRDLGRNLLRDLKENLDKTNPETAEIEDSSSLLQLLSNGGTGDSSSALIKMMLQIFQKLLATNGNGGRSEEQNVAEIEGFRSFLNSALKLVDNKLRPRGRTPEEDQNAVDNPTKLRDLGRNLIRVLQDKLQGSNQPAGEGGTAEKAVSTRFDYH